MIMLLMIMTHLQLSTSGRGLGYEIWIILFLGRIIFHVFLLPVPNQIGSFAGS